MIVYTSKIFVCFIISASTIFMFARKSLMSNNTKHHTKIVAHRGFSAQYPENTLSAFAAAIPVADMIEFDIAFSKDKQIVVMHDATIDRTTDGNGYVRNYTLKKLKLLDAGSWFDPAFSDEKIPTLKEVFDTVIHKIACNIEIKSEAFDYAGVQEIADASVALAKKYGVVESAIFSSFNHVGITLFKKCYPEVSMYLLFDARPYDRELLASPDIIDYIISRGASGINIDKALVRQELIDNLHTHDIKIGVFTVNDPIFAQKLITMGIDLIYTDNPDALTQRFLPSKS